MRCALPLSQSPAAERAHEVAAEGISLWLIAGTSKVMMECHRETATTFFPPSATIYTYDSIF